MPRSGLETLPFEFEVVAMSSEIINILKKIGSVSIAEKDCTEALIPSGNEWLKRSVTIKVKPKNKYFIEVLKLIHAIDAYDCEIQLHPKPVLFLKTWDFKNRTIYYIYIHLA